MTVDSHFHVLSMHQRGLAPDLSGTIGIDIGTDPGDYAEREPLLPASRMIFASAGAGPWCLARTERTVDGMVEAVRGDIARWDLDAVGECGEDYYRGYATPELQRELFYRQSELANELRLPLIIHSRDAGREFLSYLSSSSAAERAIFHCFSYDAEIAGKALDRGYFISFAGNLTSKGNDGIREAAAMVPDDRILVETDSPYLSPIPMRPRPCIPEFTEITLGFIADIRGTDRELLKERIIANLKAVLARDESVRKTGLSREG